MNALHTVSPAEVGRKILHYRQLPRPHIALAVGCSDLVEDGILGSIEKAAEAAGIAFTYADVSDNIADTLWQVGEALFSLIDLEPPVRPMDIHPALAFRRLWDAVIAHSDEDFLIVIGPLDEIEALPNADDILAALRAAISRYETRVQAVFVLRNWIIRQQLFWLARPTEEFAIFMDIRYPVEGADDGR